jgi:hypothetical protein
MSNINKDEQHILDLTDKQGRVDLKQEVENKFPDNLQKLIKARDLRGFLYMLINSVINWTNDNVDLRAYENQTLTVNANGQTVFNLAKIPVNPEKDAVLTVDGVKQQYGDDFTILGSVLTFIPNAEWELKPTHKVVLKYRYYLDNMGNGGGSGGGGITPSFNYIEVAIANQTNITITHNLGRLPIGISIYQSLGGGEFELVNTEVIATNTTITVGFGVSFNGKLLFV